MNAEQPQDLNAEQPATVVQLPGTSRQPDPRDRYSKPAVDLERVELDYRANKLTTREIGRLHGRSAAWVVGKAKELGWTRDLTEQARQRAQALLNAPPADKPSAVMDAVDEAAMLMAGIRKSHRVLIERQRSILADLITELEVAARGQELLDLIERANRAVDEHERLKIAESAVKRILGLPSRIYGVKKLSDAAKNLIVLERQAFDLDAPDEGKAPPPRDANLTPADVFAWMSQLKPT